MKDRDPEFEQRQADLRKRVAEMGPDEVTDVFEVVRDHVKKATDAAAEALGESADAIRRYADRRATPVPPR